jgi:alpha-L-rhamnosidase
MKSYKIILLLPFLFIAFQLKAKTRGKVLTVYDLKCENLSNPLGINTLQPRFSWKIKSKKNGTEQKSFQLLVASDSLLLKNDKADLWDTGMMESSSSLLVPYKGKKLHSGEASWWKVRIKDNYGNVSPWSPVSEFSVGLLNKEDWKASYIGFQSEDPFANCPQFKKSFLIHDPGKKLFLHVNSLGYHEVYLNGKKVGDGVLTPAVSQYNKRSLSITYDLTPLIKKGNNDLMLWLGSGWYSSKLPGVLEEGPLVKAQLERLSEKGREIILVTDSSWEGRLSSYTRIDKWRPYHYGGEKIIGEMAANDLSAQNSEAGPWRPVKVVTVPDHEVTPQMAEVNKINETIVPVSITNLQGNTYLIDMGKDLTGWVEIHFPKLNKSQEIVLDYCDALDDKGKFISQNQIDRYVASGEGPEVFRNKFNYHGFRYLKISNLETPPSKDSIRAYLIHTGYELASTFKCSDPDLNKIHDMIFYTLRCLSLGGYIVDCPQIERLGYGGDGNASTETAQTMFNLSPLYSNWLQDWSDCIRDDDDMPHTAPNPWNAGGGPYWCGFIITASWKTYLHYGDTAVLRKYYPVMQKWLGYVASYSTEGLLKTWPNKEYRNWFLGDWACPTGIDQTDQTSVSLVNNCFISVCYDCMQKIAGVLGKENDSGMYASKRDQLRKLIHQTFFHSSKPSYGTGTQIDLSYPMLAGAVPENLVNGVTENLTSEIFDKREGHFACGLVGIPVFTEWAVKNQAVDLMYSMLKQKGYPGYLNMIDKGATTTWEHWNGQRSRIHNCYNGIGSWFYQAVGGIREAEDIPAYRKVVIQPQVPNGITWAKTTKETPYGSLDVNWKIKQRYMVLNIKIPVGVEAQVPLPSETRVYLLNGKKMSFHKGDLRQIRINSGKYIIIYKC